MSSWMSTRTVGTGIPFSWKKNVDTGVQPTTMLPG